MSMIWTNIVFGKSIDLELVRVFDTGSAAEQLDGEAPRGRTRRAETCSPSIRGKRV
jgi:hypothetical protein